MCVPALLSLFLSLIDVWWDKVRVTVSVSLMWNFTPYLDIVYTWFMIQLGMLVSYCWGQSKCNCNIGKDSPRATKICFQQLLFIIHWTLPSVFEINNPWPSNKASDFKNIDLKIKDALVSSLDKWEHKALQDSQSSWLKNLVFLLVENQMWVN